MLVDDDDATNFVNQIIIRKSKVTENVKIARNGKEAIQIIRNDDCDDEKESSLKPYLILLDINMPVMDGWQFLEAYDALPERLKGHFIIVMLTSSFNPDDESKSKTYDSICGFRNKPLSVEILNEIAIRINQGVRDLNYLQLKDSGKA